MANLAGILLETGGHEAAVELRHAALAGFRARLGERHPDTVQCQADLAGNHEHVYRDLEPSAV